MKYQNRLQKFIVGSTAIVITALALPLLAQEATPRGTQPDKEHKEHFPHDAKSFIKNAAEGNLAEVQLGQLAEQKAEKSQVKDFAKRMVQDHNQANEKLRPIAQQHNIEWPKELERKHRHEMTRLEKLNGSEFDKEYTKHMIHDHAKDVREYTAASKHLEDAALKQYVQSTLPILQEHLKDAMELGQTVGLSEKEISSLSGHAAMGAPGMNGDKESGSMYKDKYHKGDKDYEQKSK